MSWPARAQPGGRTTTTPGRVAFALASAALLLCCAKKDDVIVQTGKDHALTTAAIDADPLSLLPPNPIAVMSLDARQLFASKFGSRLLAITQRQSPLPASADFDPDRDLERVYLGFYSLQGADVAGVALGHFNAQAIASAAESNPRTSSGLPVVKSEYTGRALYTSQGIGFTVLTERTLLFGNETGMRRALDRISDGRAERKLLPWMTDVLEGKRAPITLGADFSSQPVSEAVREQAAFVDGLKTLSLLGNFQDPGLNLAGTLNYDTPDAATRGAENLRLVHGRLATYTTLMALLGIPQPVRSLEARAEEKQVRFVAGVDGNAVLALLEKAGAYLDGVRKASAPPAGAN